MRNSFWFFLFVLAAGQASAESILRQVEIDLTLSSPQTCRREQAVYFGRHGNHAPASKYHFLQCSLRSQSVLYQGTQMEGAAAAWLKLSESRSGTRFVGLGLQFETADGQARVKIRGGGLSIMYQASFWPW